MTPAIEQLFSSFAANLYAVVRAETRAEVADMLDGIGTRLSNGRMPHTPLPARTKHAESAVPPKKARKKGPIQLCPAPGCKERAAPSLRMLCKKHKDAPKTTVAKWREARRAKAKKAA